MKNCLYCIDVYTVSEGDTLYSIAEKYELPVSLLMKVNGIENPYNLQIGTRLCIPGTADQLPAAPESCAKKHTVKAGDTLYLIAKMHNVKIDALMRSTRTTCWSALSSASRCSAHICRRTAAANLGCLPISPHAAGSF